MRIETIKQFLQKPSLRLLSTVYQVIFIKKKFSSMSCILQYSYHCDIR